MRALCEQSGYTLDAINNIWIKPAYEGIAYNDGDEIEKRIASIIQKASDLSVLSSELRQHCTDWPSLYHLSGTRANIMRPFESSLKGDILEIGAGCGAITRYLGERGANVLALEGSPRRAAIARSRTRDLENVIVLAERFDHFQCDHQFDVITLIGVLEYASLFTPGENPPLAMLERVRMLLKPEGKLIIAIENQLGLKYFAGAPEDHLGQPMVGIEGRYRNDQPKTFGRAVLANMLEQAGFIKSEFLLPFPDYKLPVSILTENGINRKDFDAAAFAWQSVRRDPQLPAFCNFSPELAWLEVFQNELSVDLANSFLIIASLNARTLVDARVLAYHYSTDRIAKYCKETVFYRKDNKDISVQYRPFYKANDNTDSANNHLIRFTCQNTSEYVLGKPLSHEFISLVTKDGWSFDQVGQFISLYLSIVETFARSAGMQVNTASPYTELPGEIFDIVPQNIIIREDGSPSLIDKEWQLVDSIEVGHLLFRSFLLLINSISRFGRAESGETVTRHQFIDRAFAAANLRLQDEDYGRYISLEARIQQTVTGRAGENFLNWGKDQPLAMLSLSQAVAERDGQIAHLNKAVAERDGQIAHLNQAVAERERQIASLNQVVVERDALRATLAEVFSSRSWRITSPIRTLGRLRQIKTILRIKTAARSTSRFLKRDGWTDSLQKAVFILRREGLRGIKIRLSRGPLGMFPAQPSGEANSTNDKFTNASFFWDPDRSTYALVNYPMGYTYISPRRLDDLDQVISAMQHRPRFSIIVPVYNTPTHLLKKAVDSVTSQWYPYWELVLVDDASTSEETNRFLAEISDPRIIVFRLSENQGIAGATNAGIEKASGNFVVFLDHDDELTEDCLFELACCIERENPDYIYSDEDKISPEGWFVQPHFKPDWSPDTMMSTMYTCHVSCVRRSLLEEVGGLRSEYDGCQDWDLVLRLTEKTDRISHIPKVLYHWRIIPGSTAADLAAKSYVLEASKKVRLDALHRRGFSGELETVEQVPGYFRVKYHIQGSPLISIIIPTRDNYKVLERCLDSILGISSYPNYEIIVIDNGSVEFDTISYLKEIEYAEPRIKVIRHDAPFNFSELNNIGVPAARGEILLFLNDDTEIISSDWLERMGGYAQLPHVGAVGAKLLYPGGREVQHAGILNLADGPVHAFLRQSPDTPGYFMRSLLEYNWFAVTGACLMISREKFLSVGAFNEAFPVAYNDVELCIRLLEAGLYNVVCQAVRLVHHESASRGLDHVDPQKLARLKREQRHLYELHPKYFQYDPFHNSNLHPSGLQFELAS